jgi:anti-sigma factor RsiW
MTTAGAEQLSCQELVELVTVYLEGALPPDEHARFEEHAANCTGCREYLTQMRATVQLTGRLNPGELSAEAERTLLVAFANWKTS